MFLVLSHSKTIPQTPNRFLDEDPPLTADWGVFCFPPLLSPFPPLALAYVRLMHYP